MEATRSRVLITGASRGIGRAAALELARRGYDVVLAGRDLVALESARREAAHFGVRAEALALDVIDDASVRDGVAQALDGGALDALVNNAGVFQQRLFLAQDAAWRRHELEVNYFGAQRVTAAALPAMIARGTGTIVNVSSLISAIPCPSVANYCGSKAALNAWSHALQGEVECHGVRVVVFLPSHTDTENARKLTRFDGVPALGVEYTARQLVRALEKHPRQTAASPVFRAFLRLAGVFPRWAEGQIRASTKFSLTAGELG
ncbi:MAG TPA: SDR family NAD(P)-dependent oxidoreductase [Myxococcota bacterium]